MPRYAKLGETVVLRCNHTVTENQLYKVQWTKSGVKLFQYIRGRNPPYINHTIPGAKIDVSVSGHAAVVRPSCDPSYINVHDFQLSLYRSRSARGEGFAPSPEFYCLLFIFI